MPSNSTFSKLKKLKNSAYRKAFVQSTVESRIAYQIRVLREARGWTQLELAKRMGKSSQASVARLEDPTYGRYSLGTLLKVANAFDTGVSIKFVSFGHLLIECEKRSERYLNVTSFEDELPLLTNRACGLNVINIQVSGSTDYAPPVVIKSESSQGQAGSIPSGGLITVPC